MELNIKTKRATLAYYLYFLMLNFAKGLAMDGQSKTYNIIFLCSLLFLAIKLVYTKYTRPEVFAMIIMVFFGVFFALHARENTPLFAMLAIIGMKDIDFYDLMKKTVYVRAIAIILTRLACEYGILTEVDMTKPGPNGMLCHTWGYNDPNSFMVHVFIVFALVMYLNYKHLNAYYFIATMLFVQYVYARSYSKSGYLLFILLWFIVACDKFIKIKKIREWAFNLFTFIPLLVPFASFYLGIAYDKSNHFLETFNQAITGRLFVIHHYINKFPCTLLGNSHSFWLNNAGEILAIVDNLYITIYLYCGVFTVIVYVAVLFATARKLKRLGYYTELIMFSVVTIYSFMEEFPLNPIINPFGLLLAMILFKNNIPRKLENSINNEGVLL